MLALLQGQNAVIEQPRRPAPDHDIAMEERHPQCLVAPAGTAELEDRRQAEGHRDDGMVVISLVLVLMQRESRPGLVAIDQAGIGAEALEAGLRRHRPRQPEEHLRQSRPRQAAHGIHRIVAIAAPVGDPACRPAIRHGDRHLESARRGHPAERRLPHDLVEGGENRLLHRQGAPAQQQGARPQLFLPGPVRLELAE